MSVSVANIRPACVCVCGETSQSVTFDFDRFRNSCWAGVRTGVRCLPLGPVHITSTRETAVVPGNKQLCTVLASPTYKNIMTFLLL